MSLQIWLISAALAGLPRSAVPESSDTDQQDDALGSFEPADVDADPYVTRGEQVPPGAWPDAASVDLSCTGTLIHPRFVITARHCTPGNRVVFVGLTSFAQIGRDGQPSDGARRMDVKRVHQAENADIALLELERPVRDIAPRLIAADCVLDEDLFVGAEVAVVGWGATQWSGQGYTTTLQQGITRVQTPDCAEQRVKTDIGRIDSGCDPSIAPGGEIGAGGEGVDTCFGDSGGPLYLLTPRGDYLMGVTSRSYDGVPAAFPCRYGGIYARPDAVRAWIEDIVGEPLGRPVCTDLPHASVPPMAVRGGTQRPVELQVSDDGADWTVRLVSAPQHGSVEIDGHSVTYRAPKGFEGPDPFTLEVQDDGSAAWPDNPPGVATVAVELDVFEGRVPAELRDRLVGCGCDTASPGGLLVGLVGLLGLRRRRR